MRASKSKKVDQPATAEGPKKPKNRPMGGDLELEADALP
jgi:hypothetical protein